MKRLPAAPALRRLFALIAAAVMLVPAAPAAQDDPIRGMRGAYVGLGAANGMKVNITETGDEPGGRFYDSNGVEQAFGGGWKDGGLEALLNFPGRPVFVRMTPASLGLEMLVLPLSPEGQPLPEEARTLAFLRDGVAVPEQSPFYENPPGRADQVTDPHVFLASYEFWPADGVARGFSSIGERYRTMLRFYPAVHADVLWKLCQAPGAHPNANRLLAEALRGQGATCGELVATLDATLRNGTFEDWKAAVEQEKADLMVIAQCARGYVVRESICNPASRQLAEAAISLATVGDALARFR